MISSRPTVRRRFLVGLAPLLLALGVLPLMAPTCGNMAPGNKTFARNSLIIPMDVCYQSMSDDLHRDSSGTGYTPFSCPQAKAQGDAIRAYGLVYQLIRNNIAVYWIINPAKTATTDVDMSVQYNGGPPAFLYDWAAGSVSANAPTSASKIDYRGGPFVVDGSDYSRAVAVLRAYQGTFSAVKVHVSNVAFQGYVSKTMAGGWNAGGAVPPKLALLDIGSSGAGNKNAEPVIQGYLTRAGLDTAGAAGTATGTHGQIYDKLVMSDFLPTVPGDWTTSNLYKNGYQILWVPHWAAPSSCSDCTGFSSSTCPCQNKYSSATIASALATMGSFSAAGKDVFAECAGLGSFEGVFANTGTTTSFSSTYLSGGANTHFQTASPAGVWINDWPGGSTDSVVIRGGYTSPLMQIGDFPFVATSGAIEDYRPAAYQPGIVQFISDNHNQQYDVFSMLPPAGGRGTIVYLAGHSYSGTDGSFEVAGSRLVLNTLFNLGAACVETGVACNTGLLGECSQGVMGCDASGQPVCKQVKFPQAEICDGKDNDCNGLVDDGLDVGCYDGPTGTRDVGVCRGGVSSCLQRSDGSYGMSACQGEVLPSTEVCNGLDDACTGHVDQILVNGVWVSLSGSCYDGPQSSLDPATGQPRGICKAGVATCQGGTWSACAVCPVDAWKTPASFPGCEILPQTQICGTGGELNGVLQDMTCNGTINCGCTDGATQPCYDGPPGTSGVGICHGGTRTCAGGTWGECSGEQTPLARDCASSVDNDCNGVKDNLEPTCIACPAPTDEARICRVPNITRAGNLPTGTPAGVCQDGQRSCTNGVLGDCTGMVLPSPEICDGKDNNCNGQVDENPDTLCGSGFTCVTGVCVPAFCGVENPCPEGFSCQAGSCQRAGCGTPPVTCQPGQTCQFGACVDPCQGVNCGEGASCSSGFCTGGGCFLTGCPTGQVCEKGACAADPCGGVACPVGTFCRAGDCVQSCVYATCPSGQECSVDGFCEPDPCQGVICNTPGQICHGGSCVADACEGLSCGVRQVCQAGICQDDPCNQVQCPVGACSNGQCYPVTTRDSSTPVTSSSGGGCGCGTGSASPLTALLFLLLVPLARRRTPRPAASGAASPFRPGPGGAPRRGGTAAGRAALLTLAALVALAAPGCGKKGSSTVDLSTCKETCGEQQCIDLNYDPAHCGRCGTTCDSGQVCVDGTCGPSTAVAPYVTSLSPSQANHGLLAPVTVTLTGARFASGGTVRAIAPGGSVTYPATFIDSSHVSAALDLADVPITQLDLRVVNPDHVISNAVPFDVVSIAATLTGVAPTTITTGSVATLDVSGNGFTATSLCHASGSNVPDFAMPTASDGAGGLHCDLDASSLQPGTYDLWVVNDGTVASNHLQLQVVSSNATLLLTTLSPSAGQSGASASVTIVGTGFDVTSKAYYGATAANTTFIDGNHLVANFIVGAGPTTNVTVRNGGGTPSNALAFSTVSNPPVVSNLSTSPAPPYQGDNVTLTFGGSNFLGVSSITVQPPVGPTFNATGVAGTATTATGQISLAGKPSGLYSAYVTFAGVGNSSSLPFRVLSNVAVLQSVSPAGGKQGTSISPATFTVTNLHGAGTTNVIFTGPGTSQTIPATVASGTSVTATLSLAGLNTGVYTLAVQNPGAIPSNQVSFSVLPGSPSITTVSPSCVVQSDTPATITLTGTNFALPDSQGNAVSQVMYSVDGVTFSPVPATITVNSSTQITATLDTRNAVAGVTYFVAVWNPPGPQKSNADKTLKVGSACP